MRHGSELLSWLALSAGVAAACGSYGEGGAAQDAGAPSAADGAAAGVVLRGVSKGVGQSAKSIVVATPEGTRAGDTLWAVVSSDDTSVTAPNGFGVVDADTGYACGADGAAMHVFVGHAVDAEPHEYSFVFADLVDAAVVVIALAGLAEGSTAVDTTVFGRVQNGAFEAPNLEASAPAYAIASVMTPDRSISFSVPAGMDRLASGSNLAVFGRPVERGAVTVAPVSGSEPDRCGFLHVAVLRRR